MQKQLHRGNQHDNQVTDAACHTCIGHTSGQAKGVMLTSTYSTHQIWWALDRADRLLLVASHPAPRDRSNASAWLIRGSLRIILDLRHLPHVSSFPHEADVCEVGLPALCQLMSW